MSRQILVWIWAFPVGTSLGLLAGTLGLLTGGSARRVGPTLEFHGGFAKWFLHRVRSRAMTLGHVIIGCSLHDLDDTHHHERVHVRQYELWGPAFIPAYFLSSIFQLLRGRHPYWDNSFEREAFADDERRATERQRD